MEFLSIFSVLAQRRMLLAIGAALALLTGAMAARVLPFGPGAGGAAGPAGIAQARVILDHRAAIVADVTAISDAIGTQAALLAEIVAGDTQRDAIAARAAIPAEQLGMTQVRFARLFALGQLAERAATVAATEERPYVVNVWSATPLPILTIDVTGPSGADAARVARAARATLQLLAVQRAPVRGRSVVVRPLGEVRSRDVPVAGPSPLAGTAVAIVLFVLWACALVVLSGLRRVWRSTMVGLAVAATPGRG